MKETPVAISKLNKDGNDVIAFLNPNDQLSCFGWVSLRAINLMMYCAWGRCYAHGEQSAEQDTEIGKVKVQRLEDNLFEVTFVSHEQTRRGRQGIKLVLSKESVRKIAHLAMLRGTRVYPFTATQIGVHFINTPEPQKVEVKGSEAVT